MHEFTNEELKSTDEVTEEIVMRELTIDELESVNGGAGRGANNVAEE